MPGPERSSDGIDRIHSLRDLMQLVVQDEEGLARFVYPNLQVGDVWWIPDKYTGLPKVRHPWVLVHGYSPARPQVVACLRTTTYARRDEARGLILPAGLLPDLDRLGLIVLNHERRFSPASFRDFEHIGRLPEEWVARMVEVRKSLRGASRSRA